jgi:hypothetical protein
MVTVALVPINIPPPGPFVIELFRMVLFSINPDVVTLIPPPSLVGPSGPMTLLLIIEFIKTIRLAKMPPPFLDDLLFRIVESMIYREKVLRMPPP